MPAYPSLLGPQPGPTRSSRHGGWVGTPCPVLRHAAPVLPWVAVRVHDVTGCDLGIAPVPWPVELGDEITVDGHPWPVEIVDLVWAQVAALVKVRAAVLHAV